MDLQQTFGLVAVTFITENRRLISFLLPAADKAGRNILRCSGCICGAGTHRWWRDGAEWSKRCEGDFEGCEGEEDLGLS
jgi:hypothetical protein